MTLKNALIRLAIVIALFVGYIYLKDYLIENEGETWVDFFQASKYLNIIILTFISSCLLFAKGANLRRIRGSHFILLLIVIAISVLGGTTSFVDYPSFVNEFFDWIAWQNPDTITILEILAGVIGLHIYAEATKKIRIIKKITTVKETPVALEE